MALFQPPRYCPDCGKQLEEIHYNFKHLLIGDTFMGYKPHKCEKFLEKFKKSLEH